MKNPLESSSSENVSPQEKKGKTPKEQRRSGRILAGAFAAALGAAETPDALATSMAGHTHEQVQNNEDALYQHALDMFKEATRGRHATLDSYVHNPEERAYMFIHIASIELTSQKADAQKLIGELKEHLYLGEEAKKERIDKLRELVQSSKKIREAFDPIARNYGVVDALSILTRSWIPDAEKILNPQ